MKELTELLEQPLLLKQPSFFKRYYELRTGESVLGFMQLRGFFGNRAEVGFGTKKWEIYKPSIWRNTWDIREFGYENPLAQYERKLFKRTSYVQLPVGEKVKIVFALFKNGFEIQTENDTCLIRGKGKVSWTDTMEIFITSNSETVNKYPWLIMLAKMVANERKQSRSAVISFKFGGV